MSKELTKFLTGEGEEGTGVEKVKDEEKKLPLGLYASVDLRELKSQYSPDINPLIDPENLNVLIPKKKKLVRSDLSTRTLVDSDTGEIVAAAIIRSIEEKDNDEFVKVFAVGIAALYDLTKTGQRVFGIILSEYEKTPMTGGYADSIYLAWFNGGLLGRDVGMSERTFNRGLKELLLKKFLAPRSPNTYWINPAMFFKGDRVLFVREFRKQVGFRKRRIPSSPDVAQLVEGGNSEGDGDGNSEGDGG